MEIIPPRLKEPLYRLYELRLRQGLSASKPALPRHIAENYRHAYLKNAFREQMWTANYRRLLRSDPDLFATLRWESREAVVVE